MRSHSGMHLASTSRAQAHSGASHRTGSSHGTVAARARFHGQHAIESTRTLEIQQALVREHYLTDGEATGQWDQGTRDAMIRFQSDNHWQTKILPDSRALIKLGLGPSQQNLLNPETAAIAMPGPSAMRQGELGGAN
jgi:peptidoglycan hydrolase-like protein with peptidoglycan-binding domain